MTSISKEYGGLEKNNSRIQLVCMWRYPNNQYLKPVLLDQKSKNELPPCEKAKNVLTLTTPELLDIKLWLEYDIISISDTQIYYAECDYDNYVEIERNLLSLGFPKSNIFPYHGFIEEIPSSGLPNSLEIVNLDFKGILDRKILEFLYNVVVQKVKSGKGLLSINWYKNIRGTNELLRTLRSLKCSFNSEFNRFSKDKIVTGHHRYPEIPDSDSILQFDIYYTQIWFILYSIASNSFELSSFPYTEVGSSTVMHQMFLNFRKSDFINTISNDLIIPPYSEISKKLFENNQLEDVILELNDSGTLELAIRELPKYLFDILKNSLS